MLPMLVAHGGLVLIEVRSDGAFSVNGLGLHGAPFPLTFSVRGVAGCWTVRATAATATELADLLVHAAKNTIAVVDVATNDFVDEEYVQWKPSRMVAQQATRCTVHDFGGLADGVVGLSVEALVMSREEFPGFLEGWYPYELTLVGLPEVPTAERLDEIGLEIGTARHDRPILPNLPGCCLWYSGHDDCYVWVETTERQVAAAILGRLLALLVGSALADTGVTAVTEPADSLVEDLLQQGSDWAGTVEVVSVQAVTVSLAATSGPWRLDQPLPEEIDRVAVYDVEEARWRLAARQDRSDHRGSAP